MTYTRSRAPRSTDSLIHPAPWLIGLLMLAAVVRLSFLDRVPPALNQDEASFGYNAWALLETGADRAGDPWPFFSRSFGPGDFPATLSVFVTIPFVATMGPTTLAFRLPIALAGVATAWLLFIWLRRRLGDIAALIAAAALAIDPWHILLSRSAHEAALAPLLLVLGLLGLDRAGMIAPPVQHDDPTDKQHEHSSHPARYAFLAGVMLALHAWLYSATRMFTPLFVFALVALQPRLWRGMLLSSRERQTLFALVIGLLLGGVPLWWTALRNPERLTARVGATLIDFNGQPASDSLAHLLNNLLIYLDPRLWFISAKDIVGTPLPGLGLHLWIAAPLMIAGLFVALRRLRCDAACRLLIAWLILAPLPAVICREDHPHSLRTVSGVLLWPLLAGIGAHSLRHAWSRQAASRRRVMAVLMVAAGVLNLGWFVQRYFFVYPARTEPAYQSTLYAAMRRAIALAPGADFILTTGRANQAYIYALLAEPIPPQRLRETHMIREAAPGNFDQVLRVGRWFFAPTDPVNFPHARTRFEEAWNALPAHAKGLVITTPGVFTGGALVETISCASGKPEDAYEVRAVSFGGP